MPTVKKEVKQKKDVTSKIKTVTPTKAPTGANVVTTRTLRASSTSKPELDKTRIKKAPVTSKVLTVKASDVKATSSRKHPDIKVKTLSKGVTEYMHTQQVKKHKRVIFWSILGGFIVLFFIFAFLARPIFGKDHPITKIAQENVLEVFNVYSLFTNNADTIFRTISCVIVVFVIMLAILLLLKLGERGSQRSKTIFSLIGSFVKYIGAIVMLCWVLAIWGVDVAVILAGAGVIGIVIGLGAQSLISDILSGIFIVFENTIQVGDVITFNGFRGEVIEIGIRTTKTRSIGQDVNVINNSEIRNFINMSKHRSVAVSDITIGYGENLEKVEKIIKDELPKIAAKVETITEVPQYVGVDSFTERGTVLRIVAKCIEIDRIKTARALNRELKLLFDKHKIKIAVPQIQVKNSSASHT